MSDNVNLIIYTTSMAERFSKLPRSILYKLEDALKTDTKVFRFEHNRVQYNFVVSQIVYWVSKSCKDEE